MIGKVHSASVQRAGARITGVLASSPARLDAAVRTTGAERATVDLEELIADADVLHVCTPNALHAEQVEAALATGLHVVCEKPLATSLESARSLTAQSETSGRVTTVPFVYRFHPMVREMRAKVAAGDLGALAVIHGGYLQDWLSAATSDNWRVDAAAGGPSRAFADIGSHWCDLMEFVVGDRITKLSARTSIVRPERNGAVATEDLVTLQFETTSGVLGSAVICQVAAGRKNRLHLELSGTASSLAFDQEQPELLWHGRAEGNLTRFRDPDTLSKSAARYALLPPGHAQGYQDCFDAFVADTYETISTGEAPDGLPMFTDGLRAAALTHTVLESAAAEGHWQQVSA